MTLVRQIAACCVVLCAGTRPSTRPMRMPCGRQDIHAESILFESGDTMVFQSGSSRALVKGTNDDCHKEFADIECTVGTGTPQCESRPVPYLGYIRSMIGGAVGIWKTESPRIALLGLGPQHLTTWLLHALPNAKVDGIDLDEDIVKATPYLGIDLNSPNLALMQGDACTWLKQQTTQKYDAIFVDLFTDDDHLPPCVKTKEFFQDLRTKLLPASSFTMNLYPEFVDSTLELLLPVFGDGVFTVSMGSPGSDMLTNKVLVVQSSDLGAAHLSIPNDVRRWRDDAHFQPVKQRVDVGG
eukprot:TRINITY_DN107506_c0_g1_i1.p1 TRINITY_DN107506_c0_g1~~TRINITY_DN107506_c0_g1_i1.p1  ORF type:complete len:297 (+),score=32.20 TRINITY_DN107506_c0_g1_i1:94-984(+)